MLSWIYSILAPVMIIQPKVLQLHMRLQVGRRGGGAFVQCVETLRPQPVFVPLFLASFFLFASSHVEQCV